MKIKIFLLATLLAFSTYSLTHASTFAEPLVSGDAISNSHEAETTLDEYEEIDLLAPGEVDKELSVDNPPVKTIPKPQGYTVAIGDNLYRIALNHSISLDSLKMWNSLEGELIHPGDVLIVSGNIEDAGTVESESDTITAAFVPTPPPPASDGKEMLVTATAYTAYCTGCSGTTAYGIDLRANPNQKVIAVDPKVIPLGTKVWVEGYGEAIAGDIGGAIKGNKIDVFIPSYNNAMEWGVKKVKLKVLN
ncbi:3D domain-containing protein [Sporosarcina sp. E16_8]|uniref:3D domain-containing protein n=1 Tax=Sporosarcina sp. E16_8 TaxID=2789295 RepID=UPI001A90E834|nr:3D domain-containing protein [Sporosarcina sp. E16_8]MBO0587398.1 LysM peptidoglycan-binding domain-containing protein [Sporosarcina sp. E16_8]